MAATAQVAVRPEHLEARGQRRSTVSRWLIQICCGPPHPANKRLGGVVEIERGEAVLALVALAHLAAEQRAPSAAGRSRCRAPAGPAGEDRGIHRRAARVVDAARAAGDDDPSAAAQFGRRGFAGQDFGVNAELADLAGYQMAVLAARVQDGDLRVRECSRSPVLAVYRVDAKLPSCRLAACCIRCTIIFFAFSCSALAFGIDSIAFRTIGSVSTPSLRASSTPKAVMYISRAQLLA